NKRRAVLESEIAGLQEQIKLGERLMSVSQQAAQAINDLQLSGANPLSVQGRLGLAGGNVQQLLTAFRFADPAGRADAASSLMAALQQRLQLAGEAFQRPSDEYQQIYNEVISSYTEIQAATKTDAEKLLDVQQQIAEKQAEIGEIDKAMQKLGERQLELTAQMQAQLDAINANAYAQYQIYEAIGLEAYRQAERVAQEQLNAITGGIDVQLYIAKIQTLTQQTLEAILATLQGGAYVPLPGSTTGPVTGPAGGPVGGSTIPVNPSGPVLPNSPTNPSGPLLPSGSGGPGPQPRDTGDPGGPIETPPIVIITRQPIVLNDRVMGEQIMETIVQNGRLIKQVVEVS
ncbi:MAG: hypothetical protein JNM52_04595, partial [Betaproteobacteria bacterium]|nr:hypothetical protein [Betaproteobacteria bacterium]